MAKSSSASRSVTAGAASASFAAAAAGSRQLWSARWCVSAMKSICGMSLRWMRETPSHSVSTSTSHAAAAAASGCSPIAAALDSASGTIAAPHSAGTSRCGARSHAAANGSVLSYGHDAAPRYPSARAHQNISSFESGGCTSKKNSPELYQPRKRPTCVSSYTGVAGWSRSARRVTQASNVRRVASEAGVVVILLRARCDFALREAVARSRE